MDVIEVKNLTKVFKVSQRDPGFLNSMKSLFHRRYKEVRAVDNISFSIGEGELVGLIGQNGAGKTTTLKMLSGLLYPDAGSVHVLGYKPQDRKPEFQKQFAFVAGQRNQLWWDLPPVETFLLNKEIYEVSDKDYKERVSYLSKLLNLDLLLSTPVKKLSLGQRMKAELIASLLHQPKVLFLDEPTIGLDIIAQSNMHDFILEYNKKFNATIVLTSHYMQDVEKLCERVIIIDCGKILYDGKLAKIAVQFTTTKRIRLTLEEKIDYEKLQEFGEVSEFEFPEVAMEVKRTDTANTARELLQKFKVRDLTIEDPPIEEIIKKLFEKNK